MGQGPLNGPCLFFHAESLCRCQEKPTYESLAILFSHAAVVVQVLLQVGEGALDLVVRVGHPLALFLLVGEQVWQVEVDAVHGRPQAAVAIALLPVLQHRLLVDGVAIIRFPCVVVFEELFLGRACQPVHYAVERSRRQQLGILRDIAPHDLLHVELAHLDVVG